MFLAMGNVSAQPGFIDLKNGERIEGIIDLSEIESKSQITITPRRGEFIVELAEINALFVYKEGHFIVRPVIYSNDSSTNDTTEVLLQGLTKGEGVNKFFKALADGFEFVVENNGEYFSLLAVENRNTDLNQNSFLDYRDRLREVVLECNEITIAESFQLSKDDLTELANAYNDCVNKTKPRLGITLIKGFGNSTIDFNTRSSEGEIYDISYSSTSSYYGIGLHSNAFKFLDFGASFEIADYNFNPVLNSQINSAGSFDYSELKIKLYVDYIFIRGAFSPSIQFGTRGNFTNRDFLAQITAKGKVSQNVVSNLTLKSKGSTLTQGYFNVFAAPKLSLKLSDSMMMSMSYYFSSVSNDRISANTRSSSDTKSSDLFDISFVFWMK
ncbi:MAG: hypothetical protein NXI08_07365 [bacterium]|nr:hypothetical protein [bacterium]